MLTASAERRFAAISNEVRVRVEASKKRLMTVLPRRVGTFLIVRAETSLNDSAVSRIMFISSIGSSLIPRRSFLVNAKFSGQWSVVSDQWLVVNGQWSGALTGHW